MQRTLTLVTRIAFACAMLVWLATPASAQIPTGTITGRVIDAGALPTPGVTVALESPNLQGTRTTVTAQNGDYIFRLCRRDSTRSRSRSRASRRRRKAGTWPRPRR